MSDDNKLRTYLRNHPKTLSTLFGLTVALPTVIPITINQASVINGP